MKLFFYKFFTELAYNFIILFLISVGMSFFSPIFYTHPIQGFLDIWILFVFYLVVAFIVKFIISAVYEALPIHHKLDLWIRRIGNTVFYLILTSIYYSKIFAIVYYWIMGSSPSVMFNYIHTFGMAEFLKDINISVLQFIFIDIALLTIFLFLFFILFVVYQVLLKFIKRSKSKIYLSFVSYGAFFVITILAFHHYRFIFTTPNPTVIINKQYAFFHVNVTFPFLQNYQQKLIQSHYTKEEKSFFKKIKIINRQSRQAMKQYNKTGTIKLPPPIQVPLLPEHKKKNIIFFVIDTTRYDVFQFVAEKDPWLKDFMKENSVFTNHTASGNGTVPSVESMIISFPLITSKLFDNLNSYGDSGSDYNLSQYKRFFPIFIRTLDANYDNNRKFIIGFGNFLTQIENHHKFWPISWWQGYPTKKNNYYSFTEMNNNKNYTNIWEIAFLFTNALNQTSNTPFMMYFQPQTVHANGAHNITFPVAHVVKGRSLNHNMLLKTAEDSVEVAILALKYMVKELKVRGLYDNTIIIITSDHGELYGEYGLMGHGNIFSKELYHVPLVIHWPGKKPHVYNHRTSHYDIVPTLMKDYFEYKGDISKISIGKNLFNSKKQWAYMPMNTNGSDAPALLMPNGDCFVVRTSITGCTPESRATGVSKQSLNQMLYYYTLHASGFGLLSQKKRIK